ncbi:MAG: glutathione peroxidase [Capsulimonadales bacterium]|nr:glutathione peroxidase [Capsulimonadales bacterium]
MSRNTFVTLWAFAASLALLLSLLPGVHANADSSVTPPTPNLPLRTIDGFEVPYSRFQGKVLLIVNTASQSGYTPQYAGLEKLYARFKNQGLEILAFPTNDFGGEEPGSSAEIRTFATMNYGVSFPLFAKVNLKGPEASPLFAYLTSKEANPEIAGPITDSFTKFLVSRDGRVLARFAPGDAPLSPEVVAAVEAALNRNAPFKLAKRPR